MPTPPNSDLADTYRRYFPMILCKCSRILRGSGDAQDVAQETFIRLWQSQDLLRDPKATVAWIYRTATNLAIDKLRADRFSELPVEMKDEQPDAEEISHARHYLRRLVGTLSEDQMLVAVLSRVDGMNHREIGEVMGTSERTVRRILDGLNDRLEKLRAQGEA
jgi:RNA polymerase sigma-70 factor, ECF subfamily